MGDLSPNFSRSEFACRCGCGFDGIRMELVEKLQRVRDQAGPLIVRSGCRCPDRNRSEGGKTDSAHLTGWAADLACPDNAARYRLAEIFLREGIHRLGFGAHFIHADVHPDKPGRRIWLYPDKSQSPQVNV